MEYPNYIQSLPRSAFRYWPSGDYVKTGSDKSIVRFIFYKTEFTAFEKSSLSEFKSLIFSKDPNQSLPAFYSDPELLRILLGCKFNIKKAYEGLQASMIWRSVHLSQSFSTLLPFCSHLLNSGCIYFHGRDHRFRPLLVLNISRFDFKTHSVDSYSSLLCFLLEFAIQKFMLPGQIENWIVITDLCNKGISELPKSDMKRIIKVLQENFRCRMTVNYVLNSPSSIYFLWQIAKQFVEEHTIRKIKIEKKSNPAEMLKHFNRGQLERKYGGTADDLTQFWPPVFPEGSLDADGESIENYLTDKDTYLEYFPEVYSEISSNMGSVSEKVRIDLPGVNSASPSRSESCRNHVQDAASEYFSIHTDGEIEGDLDELKIELEGQSHGGCQSISEIKVEECLEIKDGLESGLGLEIERERERNEEIKSSRRSSGRREEGKAKEVDYRRRICKICSRKTCVVV